MLRLLSAYKSDKFSPFRRCNSPMKVDIAEHKQSAHREQRYHKCLTPCRQQHWSLSFRISTSSATKCCRAETTDYGKTAPSMVAEQKTPPPAHSEWARRAAQSAHLGAVSMPPSARASASARSPFQHRLCGAPFSLRCIKRASAPLCRPLRPCRASPQPLQPTFPATGPFRIGPALPQAPHSFR